MRASQSNIDGARRRVSPADRIMRRLDPGPNPDSLVFAIFSNFEILLAAVYTGIGQRALELAVAAAHRRTSLKAAVGRYAQDPDIRWRIADAAIAAGRHPARSSSPSPATSTTWSTTGRSGSRSWSA